MAEIDETNIIKNLSELSLNNATVANKHTKKNQKSKAPPKKSVDVAIASDVLDTMSAPIEPVSVPIDPAITTPTKPKATAEAPIDPVIITKTKPKATAEEPVDPVITTKTKPKATAEEPVDPVITTKTKPKATAEAPKTKAPKVLKTSEPLKGSVLDKDELYEYFIMIKKGWDVYTVEWDVVSTLVTSESSLNTKSVKRCLLDEIIKNSLSVPKNLSNMLLMDEKLTIKAFIILCNEFNLFNYVVLYKNTYYMPPVLNDNIEDLNITSIYVLEFEPTNNAWLLKIIDNTTWNTCEKNNTINNKYKLTKENNLKYENSILPKYSFKVEQLRELCNTLQIEFAPKIKKDDMYALVTEYFAHFK